MTQSRTSSFQATKTASFPGDITGAVPFGGIVNVRYRGAVIASSENAVEARCADGRIIHLVPFRDVNFELLEERGAGEREGNGLSFFDVVAAGEREPRAVGVIESPPPAFRELIAHAAFLSDQLDIDIIPTAEKVQRVAQWPR
jgi:uncharacterized protein (DUF427 family)